MRKLIQFCLLFLLITSCSKNPLHKDISTIQKLKLNEFLSLLRSEVTDGALSWDSTFLEGKNVTTPGDVDQILDLVFKSAEFEKEIVGQVDKLGGLTAPRLWDSYMAVYDRATAFSDGYLQIMIEANKALPTQGRIVDYGAGTANHSAGLLFFEPSRKLIVQDRSIYALSLARKKMRAVDPSKMSFEMVTSDLTKFDQKNLETMHADGALLSNVLYAIPRNLRRKVLRRIWNDLKHGGILVVHDPLPETQNSLIELRLFLRNIFIDAVKNGSPANDFDFAFLAAVNKFVLINEKELNPFLTMDEMRHLVQMTHFEIMTQRKSYYGKGQLLVVRKINKEEKM